LELESKAGELLDNPHNDDAFRLATFANGDYACIGTVQIPDHTIVDLARNESPIIEAAVFKKRSGAAGGYQFPAEEGAYCASMSKCTATHNLMTMKDNSHSPRLEVTYVNVDKQNKVAKFSVYRDILMSRNKKEKKHELVEDDVNLQIKMILEMKSRLSFLLVLVHKNLEPSSEIFKTFAEAVMRVKNNNGNWPRWRTKFECVLLEYACGTGEMKNYQQLYSHTDGNHSHVVESMMAFGRVPTNETGDPTDIVDAMKPALLIQPYEKIVWKLRCGRDVLHCKFKKTYHVPDKTRDHSNYSYVHGP
jgi:hypothetical protein